MRPELVKYIHIIGAGACCSDIALLQSLYAKMSIEFVSGVRRQTANVDWSFFVLDPEECERVFVDVFRRIVAASRTGTIGRARSRITTISISAY
jgi:hypothetical protein